MCNGVWCSGGVVTLHFPCVQVDVATRGICWLAGILLYVAGARTCPPDDEFLANTSA